MSWRALWMSVGLAFVWTIAALYAVRAVPTAPLPVPLRIFVAYQGAESYRVEATEFRIEGFCSVFYKGGVRFATVCGQHTVSEAVEVQ